jgi:hypothetical protein
MFAAGLLAGFVYAHEPSAPELRMRLEPAAAAADPFIRGTLVSASSAAIEISTASGTQRFDLAPGAPVEELAPLTGPLPDGAPANAGGHRTENGFVITGVVVLPGAAP